MAKIIKVRCNGPDKHVNEVNLDDALDKEIIVRAASTGPKSFK